jgi:hypothetical protein
MGDWMGQAQLNEPGLADGMRQLIKRVHLIRRAGWLMRKVVRRRVSRSASRSLRTH